MIKDFNIIVIILLSWFIEVFVPSGEELNNLSFASVQEGVPSICIPFLYKCIQPCCLVYLTMCTFSSKGFNRISATGGTLMPKCNQVAA